MNSPSLLRRQIPLFVTYGDIFPRPGEVVLGEGAFGSPASVSFLPKAPSLRELAKPQGFDGRSFSPQAETILNRFFIEISTSK